MKLLILTQYYPPEIGAPQNRLHELAVRLKNKGVIVEVLTAMPNYPRMQVFEKYRDNSIKEEIIDGVKVHRAKILVFSSKGILSRLLTYFSFVITSYFRGRKLSGFDFILVESPPLFLGISGITLARKHQSKLIFNVSDLWPESAEKLDIVRNKILLKLSYFLEARCYKNAFLITGQTNGIVKNIKERFPKKTIYWLPNGVDLEYYNPECSNDSNFRHDNGFTSSDLIFFYGGIIGFAQGLDVILKAADLLKDHRNMKFVIQGEGPELVRLKELKKTLKLENIFFNKPVDKQEMPGVLKSIDVAIIPLKKIELFHGAIPSKIFEALAMEIPILLGVEGEAKEHFIDKGDAGLFFEPEDEHDLAKKILEISLNLTRAKQMGENGRQYVYRNFNRDLIAEHFLDHIQNENVKFSKVFN